MSVSSSGLGILKRQLFYLLSKFIISSKVKTAFPFSMRSGILAGSLNTPAILFFRPSMISMLFRAVSLIVIVAKCGSLASVRWKIVSLYLLCPSMTMPQSSILGKDCISSTNTSYLWLPALASGLPSSVGAIVRISRINFCMAVY